MQSSIESLPSTVLILYLDNMCHKSAIEKAYMEAWRSQEPDLEYEIERRYFIRTNWIDHLPKK